VATTAIVIAYSSNEELAFATLHLIRSTLHLVNFAMAFFDQFYLKFELFESFKLAELPFGLHFHCACSLSHFTPFLFGLFKNHSRWLVSNHPWYFQASLE